MYAPSASQEDGGIPTRNISLTNELDAFVEDLVASGRYQSASEALRDALRDMKRRTVRHELEIEVLRTHLAAGLEALDRGDFVELAEDDVDAALEKLSAPDAASG